MAKELIYVVKRAGWWKEGNFGAVYMEMRIELGEGRYIRVDLYGKPDRIQKMCR